MFLNQKTTRIIMLFLTIFCWQKSQAQQNITLNPAWYNPALTGNKGEGVKRVTYSLIDTPISDGTVISFDTYLKPLKSGIGFHLTNPAAGFTSEKVVFSPYTSIGVSLAPHFNLNDNWMISMGYKYMLTSKQNYKNIFEHEIGLSINSQKTMLGLAFGHVTGEDYNFEATTNNLKVHFSHDFKLSDKLNYTPVWLTEFTYFTAHFTDDLLSKNRNYYPVSSIIHYFYTGDLKIGGITGIETLNKNNRRLISGIAASYKFNKYKISASYQFAITKSKTTQPEALPQRNLIGLSITGLFGN